MTDIMLQCLSHTPLVGFVDPPRPVLNEVNMIIAGARARIEAFKPELVVLFSPDHFNGFFYDMMPSFCIGTAARAERTDRVINAARAFVEDQTSLHPINPAWDNGFLDILAGQKLTELDRLGNDMLSAIAGRSVHEVKTWAAAFAALSRYGPYAAGHRYYREIPEWIAGFGAISARPLGA
jgi:hypothetical protein